MIWPKSWVFSSLFFWFHPSSGFILLLVSSRRMVVSVVEPISDLTFACRQRGLLWRRGGPDQWEFFTPGSKEPFKVERDTNEDGKADAVWEKGASASKSRR
jgi:hypothetical protein